MSDARPDQPDIETFRREARAWLEQVEIPVVPLGHDGKFATMRAWQKTLYDAGWMGLHWPEDCGGRGLSAFHALVFSQELARVGAPHPVGQIGLESVGPTIVSYGTEEQRRRLLPPLLSGEDIWSQGFSEPDAGSDLASLRTKAVIDGDELVISGQKVWTSWASESAWCAVLARTDPDVAKHKGISYVLVEMDLPGIEVRPIVQMTGDAEFNEVFFDEVRVPMSNVVGALGDGWKLAMDTLGHERGEFALRRGAENETAFIDLVTTIREHADPRSLGATDTMELGRLYVELRAFEAQGRSTARRMVDGDVPSSLDSVDKLTLSETEQRLYGVASDLLGPQRMVADARPFGLDAARWMKGLMYARSGSVYGGSQQVQRGIVAERLLGLPRGGRA